MQASTTSLADLEQATGLPRSSLYQAFDSKHGLFTAALERYRLTYIDPALAAMEAPGAGAAELHAYFASWPRPGPRRPGRGSRCETAQVPSGVSGFGNCSSTDVTCQPPSG
ncbi:TetR/AcrR family transcriptional regulator [Dactylosporangium sp. NPDC049742]|uniref:TetR/AcrR family transcriptional regulator n=1 Tax=Dactylosporangium sp. NPDC049742 TaxID=3154737 RepID=UPI00342A4C29